MAKKAMIEREKKRERLVKRFAAKRAELKEIARPHAYYRKLKVSRIALRELGSSGLIPGLVKSSW